MAEILEKSGIEEETSASNESCTGATVAEDTNATTEEDTIAKSETDTEEKRLTAVSYILFESHQYRPGDELPTHNLEMIEAWLEASTAVWKVKPKLVAKASPVTAQAGLAGSAIPAGDENLVGKVPRTGVRGKGKK